MGDLKTGCYPVPCHSVPISGAAPTTRRHNDARLPSSAGKDQNNTLLQVITPRRDKGLEGAVLEAISDIFSAFGKSTGSSSRTAIGKRRLSKTVNTESHTGRQKSTGDGR